MAERRCIYCGRLADLDKDALFRMPPDYKHTADEVYGRFLKARGIEGVRIDLPEVCGKNSPEFSKIIWENGKPVLVTKTGRSTDTLICPSCRNELFRDTGDSSVCSAVFFGMRDSGRTSLILALAEKCVTRHFSSDEKYRYIINDRTYTENEITEAAKAVSDGEKPADLRKPVAVYRVSAAAEGGTSVCDVMHDASESDTEDEQAINTAMPFAAASEKYVYCISADTLYEAAMSPDEYPDMRMRLEMFRLISACRYSEKPPELDIAVTKLDTANNEVTGACADEQTLKNYIYSAFPSIEELAPYFSGVRAYAVSAKVPGFGNDDLTGKLYAGIFG